MTKLVRKVVVTMRGGGVFTHHVAEFSILLCAQAVQAAVEQGKRPWTEGVPSYFSLCINGRDHSYLLREIASIQFVEDIQFDKPPEKDNHAERHQQ